MATYTTNYRIKKPEPTDFYDIEDFNGAMDTVDNTLHQCEEDTKKAVTDLGDAAKNAEEAARAAAQEVLGSKADKSNTYQHTLAAASWTGATAPYSIVILIAKVTETNNIDIIPKASTEAQIEAWQDLGYVLGTQAAGLITLQAWGKKPVIDIPITVIVRGDA